MPATVRINETNGDDGSPSVTEGIANSNYGSVDTAELDPVDNPMVPDSNSFEKWQQWEVTAMGGSFKVLGLKFFSTSPAANTTHHFNGHQTQGTYDSSKKEAYETAGTGTTKTPNTVPTSAPDDPNIGIGGSLTGEFVELSPPAAQSSDFVITQIRAGASATAGTELTNTYRYSEVA